MRLYKKKHHHDGWQDSFMKTSILVSALLLSTGASAYTSVENTSLDAEGIRSLDIRTYSGPLSIVGTDGDKIEAEVIIDFDEEWDDDEARAALEDGLVFELEKRGSRAQLNSWVGDYDDPDFSIFTFGLIDLFRSGMPRPYSHLEVRVPKGIDLDIHDFRGEVIIAKVTGDVSLRTGAGPVEITDITGDLDVNDGSGNLTIDQVSGDVDVRDGSGNMEVSRVGGRLTVNDGSGNMEIRTVGRDLDIRDGSGNIRVSDLEDDVEIRDGSGEIDVRKVKGTLSLTDGSGGIDVSDVEEDVIVFSRGSGSFNVRNVKGQVVDDGRGRRNYRRDYNYDYRYRDRDRDIDEDIDIDIDEDIDIR